MEEKSNTGFGRPKESVALLEQLHSSIAVPEGEERLYFSKM